jgi:hypothetical protein
VAAPAELVPEVGFPAVILIGDTLRALNQDEYRNFLVNV